MIWDEIKQNEKLKQKRSKKITTRPREQNSVNNHNTEQDNNGDWQNNVICTYMC